MQSTNLCLITGAALLTVLVLPPQLVAQEQEGKARYFPHYTLTDLGTLGGTSSGAFGISAKGHVGGGASVPGEYQHPFLWTKRKGMLDLGALGGLNGSASGPNNNGEMAIFLKLPAQIRSAKTFAASALAISASGPSGSMAK